MKTNKYGGTFLSRFRYSLIMLCVTVFSYGLFSFTVTRFSDNFLTTLGITKTEANTRVANNILGGYVSTYGVKSIKNLAAANQVAVAKDLLAYTKNYVSTEDFKKQYAIERENHKPADNGAPDGPEKYKAKLIAQAKESVKQAEDYISKATPENKKLFQPALDAAKKNLEDMQDPHNEFLQMYADNYATILKNYNDDIAAQNKEWEEEYPSNANLFVKKRLQEFLEVTKDVDFSAKLEERNGKKYFVNPDYEHKDSRWKMAFRAGKDVTETSRAFAQQWINEIK